MLLPRIESYSAPDGRRLFARVWSPVGEPTGRVVYLHGIISHGGWFTASCRRLAEAGLEVHFLDRRGSGLNWEERGDVLRAEVWLDDVTGYLKSLPTDRPRTLLGLSWGGRLAAIVAARSPELVDRLGLLYPGLYARIESAGWQKMLINACVSIGLGREPVKIPLSDARWFTHDPLRQRFIERDPLALRATSVRFLQAHAALDKLIADAAEKIRMPTLLMLAGNDRIVDNVRVRGFYDRIPSPDKRLIEYPAAAHTLEFEPDRQAFLEDLAGWVAAG